MADKSPDRIVFKLKHQIEVEGKKVDQLEIRTDVRARDFFAGDGAKGETEKVLRIAAHLASVPPSSLQDMKGVDFLRLMGVVGPLLEGGQETSGT